MASTTTEVPVSSAEEQSRPDNLEKDAVGLDVAVRIHGSQITAVVLDTTEHVEPFEEDTSTMIVFPRGAVVKLKARVRTGHAVVLTNLNTNQTALCRIIQVNSAANAHYVKLEFSQPVAGFWGIHFPSEADAVSPRSQAKNALIPVREIEKPSAPEMPKIPAAKDNAPVLPAVNEEAKTAAPATSARPFVPARAPVKEPAKPAAAPPPNYGVSVHAQRDLMPLAAAPTKTDPPVQKASAIVPATITVPKQASRASASSLPASESPIFDSLSTDEDIFGKENSPITPAEATMPSSDKKAAQISLLSLDRSTLMRGEAPKQRSGVVIFASLAAVILLAAGAGWYVLQHRAHASENLNAGAQPTTAVAPSIAPSAPEQSASEETPPPTTAQNAPVSSSPAAEQPVVKPELQQPAPESAITITAVHDGNATASPSMPAAPTAAGNIYAGDLTARPKLKKRGVHMAAPLPKINVTAPKDFVGASANDGLGSLIGSTPTGLPAPPTPKQNVTSGGRLVSPRLIHSVPVGYPAIADSTHVEGDVEIQAVIDKNGKVISAKAISGPALLQRAAVDAVRQWKYSPATLDGQPITMQYIVTVRFRLNQ
ncbi:MAG TPA: TonB family protein [Candidatus Acidoferrales bacterium]|nr:TonB family protein [Candidatus Acidoferrales bacterium]